ncbi:MAG: 4-hydroxy-tetrahydrodipicolinate reductase [Bacteroidota bacterium]|nr:4-hydroxy-tetrahydrodipicolinate reductase [Bacteroidota bacterium]
MKIALVGYGKLSKIVEQVAKERGHEIGLIINSQNLHEFTQENISKCEVVIELSTPENAFDNILRCIDFKIPVVSGTTGWYTHLHDAEKYCVEQNACMLTATNFSPGVNIFFKINEQLAGYINKLKDYHISIDEIHHIHKKDHPSGTASTLAAGIFANHKDYHTIKASLENESMEINSGELSILSRRDGEVPGTHQVNYDSAIDSIQITHTAHNRNGFALGAVLAAEYIYNKQGVYYMSDVLGL